MKNLGNISDPKDIVTKEYVDNTASDMQYAFTINDNGHLILNTDNDEIASGLSINSSGHLIRDINGSINDLGKVKGNDGYAPIRGVDYWTAEDIASIEAYVDDAILGGEW